MNSLFRLARAKKVILALGAVAGVCLLSFSLLAQVNTGTISGVVQDTSGASVAGATVTIKNVDTGATRVVTSDVAGRYVAPVLPVGNYEVQGQQPGFQTEVRSGIILTVGREEVINLTLKVGQTAEEVTVTAEAPVIETTTAAMSSLVDQRTIRDLPLNGRSYDQLALLQPGVVTVGAGQASAAFDFGTGTRFNVNGSRAYANTFLLDGTDIADHANGTPGGAAGTNLGVDGVQEFKINTSVSPAEYGRSSGGVISAVTRSGTNALHGSAFEFIRNNAFDSLGYFDRASHGGNDTIAPYRRNQFGGSLGGPIKKDKTFFFGTYEGLRQGNGTNISAEVPTAQTLQGILPAKVVQDSCTATKTQSFCNPATGTPLTTVCPSGAATCTLSVNPLVKPFLKLFQAPSPGPTADLGDGTGFYIAAPTQVTGENYFMTRLDHQITENMRIFARYSFDKDQNVLPNFQGSAIADEHDVAHRDYSTIQVNNTLRPTLLNSFRFAFNRTFQNFDDVLTTDLSGLPNGGSFVPGEHFGTISFGSQGLSQQPLNFLGVDNGAPREYWYNNYQWGDDVTYVRGAHAFKWGVNIERIQDNEITSSNSRGDYTFLDVPGFLVGTPIRFDAPPPGADAYRGLRETLFGVYMQDDFKVTQRFTLNLGLRWEAISNPKDANGKMANLLNLTDPAPTVLKDSYFSVAKKDFQPRVGFAWQLNGSGTSVLRAGFGIFNDHILPYSYVALASGTPPFFTTLSDLTNPIFPVDTNLTAGPSPPPQFNVFPATLKEPSKTQYTLSLQQQVMKNTVLEVAYIGSESHHLQRNGELNSARPLAPGVFPTKFLQSNRINPLFASLTASQFDANADYNALQVILRRRSVSGLQYQIFYTYSQSIDTKSTIAGGESRQEPNTVLDFLNPGLDRGRSSFDARHNVVPTITYPFPFRFQNRALSAIAGGWTVNGIGTFRTGEPFTGRVGSNLSANGDRWSPDRPNLNPGFSNNPTSGVSAGCTIGKNVIAAGTPLGTPDLWYDPCAFSKPAAGTYGNLGRNTLTGPPLYNVDFSADKGFKLTEAWNLQFRAEIFNLLDEAHFYAPGFNVFSGSAGHITRLISSPGGRLVQFGLKLAF
jgi:Carboxypeptidase regulatory-like domain/TonB dependent receptor